MRRWLARVLFWVGLIALNILSGLYFYTNVYLPEEKLMVALSASLPVILVGSFFMISQWLTPCQQPSYTRRSQPL